MSTVTLRRAEQQHAATLANLLELYCYDMSAYFPIELGADGRFGYQPLPRYFSEPGARFAYLISLDDKLAGFALARRGSEASDDPEVLDVAEFFVVRGSRKQGAGARAAALLWNELRGRWIVRVASSNLPAIAFWTRAISDYTRQPAASRTLVLGGMERQVFEFSSR
jgi:predicted acetyltransferase